jgi:hypothetical protein
VRCSLARSTNGREDEAGSQAEQTIDGSQEDDSRQTLAACLNLKLLIERKAEARIFFSHSTMHICRVKVWCVGESDDDGDDVDGRLLMV